MTGDDDPLTREVVLGLSAAWGFAPADQTSPALAAAAGALTDAAITGPPVTELRIHGVSGSSGPTMLEHPGALQVAGDGITGFYRRWSPDGGGRPSVPWRLEAYSWGGLTEQPLAAAIWLLLTPFMLYNIAFFALPPRPGLDDTSAMMGDGRAPYLRRDRGHAIAAALLRLLALAATVQFVSAIVTVAVSTVAWQAAGRPGLLPGWMGWYGGWGTGWRIALALAAVAAIIAALWAVSVRTALSYERRTSQAPPHLKAQWPLTQPGFWKGNALVGRQRAVHTAAACAAAALIAAWPTTQPAAARWVAVSFAAAVLAAAAGSAASSMTDRHKVTMVNDGAPQATGAHVWCRILLAAGVAALILTAVIGGLTDPWRGPQPGALPGSAAFLGWLLAAQVVLLAGLAITVAILAARARAAGSYGDNLPYLRGSLTPLFVLLGLLLGGLLTAVINFGVTRLLGTPVPSGFVFKPEPADALAVPWPIYAFGAAAIGLLIGASAAAILLAVRFRRRRRAYRDPQPGASSPVAQAYRDATADAGGGDSSACSRHRSAIARAWAIGELADDAAAAIALVAGGAMAAVLAAEIAAAAYAGPADSPGRLPAAWHGLASIIAVLGVLVAGWLVVLLRQAYSDPTKRKTIGDLWDVGTFWPRAVHPLAPPCYAERAIPEVVDRIRLLTGELGAGPDDIARLHAEAGLPDLARTRGLTVPTGPVLLTGYSQGAVIAPAVIAQLPPEALGSVGLLTLACPARRLYGRAFPAYFGGPQLAELRTMLDAQPGGPAGRWKNLRRRSDYIGSWIFAEPPPRLDVDDLALQVDQPCWDPVILVPDANPTPPPIHRHSQWWQDPRTHEVGAHLVKLLAARIHDLREDADRAPAGHQPAAVAPPGSPAGPLSDSGTSRSS